MPGWRLVFAASLPLVIATIFSCGDDPNPSAVVSDGGEPDREAASPADDAPSGLPDSALDAGPPKKEPPFVVLATNAVPGSLHDDPAGNIYFVTETVGASSIGDAALDEGAVVSLDPKGNVRWTYKGGRLSAPKSCGDDFGNTYVAVAITSTNVAGVSPPDGGSSTASRYALFKITPSGALGWSTPRYIDFVYGAPSGSGYVTGCAASLNFVTFYGVANSVSVETASSSYTAPSKTEAFAVPLSATEGAASTFRHGAASAGSSYFLSAGRATDGNYEVFEVAHGAVTGIATAPASSATDNTSDALLVHYSTAQLFAARVPNVMNAQIAVSESTNQIFVGGTRYYFADTDAAADPLHGVGPIFVAALDRKDAGVLWSKTVGGTYGQGGGIDHVSASLDDANNQRFLLTTILPAAGQTVGDATVGAAAAAGVGIIQVDKTGSILAVHRVTGEAVSFADVAYTRGGRIVATGAFSRSVDLGFGPRLSAPNNGQATVGFVMSIPR